MWPAEVLLLLVLLKPERTPCLLVPVWFKKKKKTILFICKLHHFDPEITEMYRMLELLGLQNHLQEHCRLYFTLILDLHLLLYPSFSLTALPLLVFSLLLLFGYESNYNIMIHSCFAIILLYKLNVVLRGSIHNQSKFPEIILLLI